MANGQVGRGFDERFAALDERVTNLRTSFGNLEASMARGFQQFESALSALGNDVRNGQRTPWAVIWAGLGVVVSVLGFVGFLLYQPVKDSQADLKVTLKDIIAAVATVPEKFVSRAEQQVLRDRANQDRDTLTDTLRNKLERNEWMLRNNTVDREIGELTRRIDEIRADFGSTYTLRDALLDLKQRLARVEGVK